jgi:hypothetical protein
MSFEAAENRQVAAPARDDFLLVGRVDFGAPQSTMKREKNP